MIVNFSFDLGQKVRVIVDKPDTKAGSVGQIFRAMVEHSGVYYEVCVEDGQDGVTRDDLTHDDTFAPEELEAA